jgi:hypothetical protein
VKFCAVRQNFTVNLEGKETLSALAAARTVEGKQWNINRFDGLQANKS